MEFANDNESEVDKFTKFIRFDELENNIDVEYSTDQILYHMQIVIDGCSKTIYLSNIFSSWKNTAKGLSGIKDNYHDFNKGIKLWVTILQDTILNCTDEELELLHTKIHWIDDLLIIKKYINNYINNIYNER